MFRNNHNKVAWIRGLNLRFVDQQLADFWQIDQQYAAVRVKAETITPEANTAPEYQ